MNGSVSGTLDPRPNFRHSSFAMTKEVTEVLQAITGSRHFKTTWWSHLHKSNCQCTISLCTEVINPNELITEQSDWIQVLAPRFFCSLCSGLVLFCITGQKILIICVLGLFTSSTTS